ncbi:MAG: hypothetical protein AB7R89_04750 [Dehalococcoidia bacterium]
MGTIEFELSTGGSVREELTRAFTTSSVRNAFKPVVMGADRHGTLVWEAAKNGNVQRFVTLSVTTMPTEAVFEAWAVASRGELFVRREVGTHSAEADRLFPYTHRKDGVIVLVERAFEVASDLNESELTESYSLDEGFTLASDETP